MPPKTALPALSNLRNLGGKKMLTTEILEKLKLVASNDPHLIVGKLSSKKVTVNEFHNLSADGLLEKYMEVYNLVVYDTTNTRILFSKPTAETLSNEDFLNSLDWTLFTMGENTMNAITGPIMGVVHKA